MINFKSKLKFLSNNVKGTQDSKKRLELYENLRKLSTPSGFVFLQETHSSVNVEKMEKWNFDLKNNFQGHFFHTVEQILVESP